ncbi:MAG: AAA-associated domain-containing protein [Acidobacteria bacterium]|nr:AAA-associated domain-containing protein [Acidobacteriota bacterium]MBI3655151.1 AAA-associated domain-containing protein [Acidobacteriota bacterium]
MDVEPLPQSGINRILGLMELLHQRGGKEDIYKLGRELNYELGDLLLVIKGGEMLGFLDTPSGDVTLERLGEEMLKGNSNVKKQLFKEQLKKLRIFQHFTRLLEQAEEKRLEKDAILEELARILPQEQPQHIFKTLVNWSRYAELFGYNPDREELYLDQV